MTLKKITTSALIVLALACGNAALAVPAYAATTAVDPSAQIQEGIDKAGGGKATADDLPAMIQNIINVLLFLIGTISVVMIIVGGIRYVTSNGDQAQVKAAKDTIMYAVVGVVVALLAFAIVNFVVDKLK